MGLTFEQIVYQKNNFDMVCMGYEQTQSNMSNCLCKVIKYINLYAYLNKIMHNIIVFSKIDLLYEFYFLLLQKHRQHSQSYHRKLLF